MMNLSSHVNDFAAFTPALLGRRVVRLVLHYDENPDTPPPFTVFYEETPTDAPQTSQNLVLQQATSSRFQIEIPISETILANGGNMSWAINDSLGNLSGQWGGAATLLPSGLPIGYIPLRGSGEYTVKSFPKLNMVALESGKFRVSDLDFINVQALSMAQAAAKARRIAALSDLSGTLIYQRAGIEYAAQPAGRFTEAMTEIARVIEFAVEEVRNQQRFDLSNAELVRYL